MAKDINKKSFSESTQLKLSIVSDFFKEWLPVFTYEPHGNELFIADFFAGSGKDADGEYGSPILLLDETARNCQQIKPKSKSVSFIFNEKLTDKYNELCNNLNEYIDNCKIKNSCNNCILKIKTYNKEFQKLFNSNDIGSILSNRNVAKFIFLDQYGIKEIKKDIFKKLIYSPKTDFIFFISSSHAYRFKELPETKQYIDLNSIKYNEKTKDYHESHRLILDYYKSLLLKDYEYYLHGFSLKNGSSFYGLIFGSGHTYGMEKFLTVCWHKDNVSGESNHNIDEDFDFFGSNSFNKKEKIKEEILKLVSKGVIATNIDGFKFVMKKGCLPSLFTEVIKELEKRKIICLEPALPNSKVSRASTSVHKVKKYFIRIIKNGK